MSDIYWDDWCMVRFLEGVCWRYVAYPVSLTFSIMIAFNTSLLKDPDASPESRKLPDEFMPKPPSTEAACKEAEKAFLDVLEHGKKIILDHHLVYHARQYEAF
jgi:hypothetical protein